MLKTIFFDAGETLIYLPRTVGEHYRDVALDFGWQPEASALDQAFRRAWKEMPARPASAGPRPDDDKGWWRTLVDHVLASTPSAEHAPTFDRNAFFEQLYAHFAGPGVWEVFPEVREVLAALQAQGLSLGVISNFDRRLYPIFDHLALTPYFESIIISSEAGADKPDPAIFRHALQVCGVAPEEALHVGDDPKCDWGAEAVGMAIFKLDRPRNSLHELLDFVQQKRLQL